MLVWWCSSRQPFVPIDSSGQEANFGDVLHLALVHSKVARFVLAMVSLTPSGRAIGTVSSARWFAWLALSL
jgi:hypothetical protein